MKTIFFTLICFVSTFSFMSCSSQDDNIYSCDDVINAWAQENISEIRSMSWAQWKKLPAEKKHAAYVAFTQQQKINFWKDKLTGLMTQDWSKEELDHIKLVYDFIIEHPSFFNNDGLTEEQENILELFFYKWSDIAKNKLGWNMKLIFAMVASGEDVILNKTRTGEDFTSGFDERIKYGPNDCHCNTSILSDFCNVTLQGICEDTSCNIVKGCGWLFMQDCNGKCSDL